MRARSSSFAARAAAGILALASVAAGGYFALDRERASPRALPTAPPARPAAPPVDTISDPLVPERPAKLDSTPRGSDDRDWVTARPGFQYSRSSAERGGANPCDLPLPDTAGFEPWMNLAQGRFTWPKSGAIADSGDFDLVLHFHGDELSRRELIESGAPFVLYSLTLSEGQSYATPFSGSKLLGQLVAAVEASLAASTGREVRARHLALSAWSAGFMAPLSILSQPEAEKVDAILLSDGLHGERGRLQPQVGPFVAYAKRAERGERFFFVTHSSIDPPGFASTTESVHYLLSALDARPQQVRRDDRYGLELVELFSQGDFHVRGYAGNDKPDHCAQVTLLRDGYAALARRWRR